MTNTVKNPALPGHALANHGVPADEHGATLPRPNGWYHSTAGPGRAMCQCGVISPELSGPTRRAKWHQQHKDTIRAGTSTVPATWDVAEALPGSNGSHWVVFDTAISWGELRLSPHITEEQARAIAARLNGC